MNKNDNTQIYNLFRSGLKEKGAKCRILSASHIPELESEINLHYDNSFIDKDLYAIYMQDYFDFSLNQKDTSIRSLIIIAIPSPQVEVTFNYDGKVFRLIIPPTYSDQVIEDIRTIANRTIERNGFKMNRVILPQKLVAVRSGLAQYGKNNITYVPGMGSYHRLTLFCTDFHCSIDNWQDKQLLEKCNACVACLKYCPTKAIGEERFVIHGERCLTYFNEQPGAFPDWILPEWHNSIVGCMKCQTVCPENKNIKTETEFAEEFSQTETEMILNGYPFRKLPELLQLRIKKLCLDDYYNVLARNLKVLISK